MILHSYCCGPHHLKSVVPKASLVKDEIITHQWQVLRKSEVKSVENDEAISGNVRTAKAIRDLLRPCAHFT